jgi:malate dehydrogenase
VVPITEDALAAAAVVLARAVLRDRRQVLSCGTWVEGAWGIPGGFVTAPVRVGARGAEEPLPLRLTLEEQAFLQRAAADSTD